MKGVSDPAAATRLAPLGAFGADGKQGCSMGSRSRVAAEAPRSDTPSGGVKQAGGNLHMLYM